MYTINDLYDLDHTLASDYLKQFTYPWEALKGIKDFILSLGETLNPDEYVEVSEHVWVHKTAKVFQSAYLEPRAEPRAKHSKKTINNLKFL